MTNASRRLPKWLELSATPIQRSIILRPIVTMFSPTNDFNNGRLAATQQGMVINDNNDNSRLPEDAYNAWRAPVRDFRDIRRVWAAFVLGRLPATPWHGGPLVPDHSPQGTILSRIQAAGMLTTTASPAGRSAGIIRGLADSGRPSKSRTSTGGSERRVCRPSSITWRLLIHVSGSRYTSQNRALLSCSTHRHSHIV